MEYPKVCLRRGEEGSVLKGQRLIYDNELDWADDICTDGCVVDVLDSRQRFAARGFFNSNSRLAVRVLTRDEAEPIDRAFLPAGSRRRGTRGRRWVFPIPAASSSVNPTGCRD